MIPAIAFMLDERLINSNPDWWRKIDANKYYLVMTDDLDGYYSCTFLQMLFGLKIGGFFDFKRGLYLNEDIASGKQPIFIDCCVAEGKAFDNHYSFLTHRNKEMVTFNRSVNKYNNKYNGSTLAMLIALYDYDLWERDEGFFEILLCVDSWYKGIYSSDGRYAHITYDWMEKLGMLNYLKPITDNNDAKYFQQVIDEDMLSRKFWIDADGYITTVDPEGLDKLPKCKFELVMPVKQGRYKSYELQELGKTHQIFSAAEVCQNTYQLSYIAQ